MTPRAIAVGAADYADGSYFAYAYDEVGNRTSEVACWGGGSCTPITTTYAYDDANRLIEVDGQPYTWDANGNLISFGSTTYSYDAANRLTDYVVQLGPSAYYGESYTYNGLGDRVQRTVYPSIGGTSVTTYTLDLAAGLTQVLADGTYTYLYGQGRIAQFDGAGFDYFLGDALGSVRQLADESGAVTLARRYEPYGDGLESVGTGETSYDFTGELRDSTGLVFLRARYYASYLNQFIQPDSIVPDQFNPQSWHKYLYANNNPTNLTDPTGHSPWPPENVQALQTLKPHILISTQRHNQSASGFSDEAFAALIAAHLNRESRFGALTLRRPIDMLGNALGYCFGYNASTGIANIRPSVGIETLRGELDVFPHPSSYTVYGSQYEEFIRKNTRIIGGATVIPGDQDRELRRFVFLELQDPVLSIEYLAANLERGVDRAIGKGIAPSVFNLGSWLWRGVQRRDEFELAWRRDRKKLNAHGIALVNDMSMAFQVLGLPMASYNAYNPYEADLMDGSFYNQGLP